MEQVKKVITWNPFNSTYKEDPISYINHLREVDPVHQGVNGHWILTRHNDIKRVLNDEQFRAYNLPDRIADHGRHRESDRKDFDSIQAAMHHWILYLNAPEHTKLKSTIFKVWKRLEVEALIERLVRELLVDIAGNGKIDFITEFATPLPVQIMNKIMGLENAGDDMLREWSLILTDTQEPFAGLRAFEKAESMIEESTVYFKQQIAKQRTNPNRDNFLSDYLYNSDVSDEEIISIIHLIFIAGIETTITIFGNIVSYLMENRLALTAIKDNPTKLQEAVEELLRLNNSARYVSRIAIGDHVFGDKCIKDGDILYLSLFAANHDPDVFDHPDDFKIDRENNPHLSFGYGAHHCLGAQLARLEIKTFLKHVIDLDLNFEPAGKTIIDHKSVIFRRVLQLPVIVSYN